MRRLHAGCVSLQKDFLSHLVDVLDEETDSFEIVRRGFPNQTAFLLKQE